MDKQEPQELFNPTGFARQLGVSRWTFLKWRKSGMVPTPHIHRGRISRWTAEAVRQFVAQGVKA